jgi:hypothetical protein
MRTHQGLTGVSVNVRLSINFKDDSGGLGPSVHLDSSSDLQGIPQETVIL